MSRSREVTQALSGVQPFRSKFYQRGATAVEFALIFPLFFAIFYAIVGFSLIFIAQQSLTLAAEEGARAALNFQASDNLAAALTRRSNAACSTATAGGNWLAGRANCAVTANPCAYDTSMQCVTVTLVYDYVAHPLMPLVPFLDLVLPSQLTSSAMIQLNPGYLL